ncbi:MAG: pilus assembly protein [Caulobacterales bacterium]|nr:pilus assembly protein [Caulobacterales bacterium]
MRLRRTIRAWGRHEGGAAAVEYAFILPMFVMLVMGVISTAQLASAINGMHFAVAEAARCWAVNATTCGSTTATVTFAQSRYVGPDIHPTFLAGSADCGRTVTVTGSYTLELAITEIAVPLSAAACYPAANLT